GPSRRPFAPALGARRAVEGCLVRGGPVAHGGLRTPLTGRFQAGFRPVSCVASRLASQASVGYEPRSRIHQGFRRLSACRRASPETSAMKKEGHPDYHFIEVVMTDGTKYRTRS